MFSPFFFIAVLFTAAEAKSHGTDKRSLRRPTPWSLQKKIIVFGGAAAGTTAVLVTGGILFYVYYPSNPAKSSEACETYGSNQADCDAQGSRCVYSDNNCLSGCAADRLLTAKGVCTECPNGKPLKTNKGGKNFGDLDGTTSDKAWETTSDDCSADGCRANFHQATSNVCSECPDGEYIDATSAAVGASVQATCTGCKAGWHQATANASGGCTECAPGTSRGQAPWGTKATVCEKTTLPIKITMEIGWNPNIGIIKKWTLLTERVSESMKNTLLAVPSKFSSPVTSFSVNATFVDEERSAAGRYFKDELQALIKEKPRNLVAIFEIKGIKETTNLMEYIGSSRFKKKLEAKLKKKKYFDTVKVKDVEKLNGLPGKYCIKVFKKPEERLNVTTGAEFLQLDKPLTWLPAADGDVRCYANNIWIVKKSEKMRENEILYSSNYGVTWKPMMLRV